MADFIGGSISVGSFDEVNVLPLRFLQLPVKFLVVLCDSFEVIVRREVLRGAPLVYLRVVVPLLCAAPSGETVILERSDDLCGLVLVQSDVNGLIRGNDLYLLMILLFLQGARLFE